MVAVGAICAPLRKEMAEVFLRQECDEWSAFAPSTFISTSHTEGAALPPGPQASEFCTEDRVSQRTHSLYFHGFKSLSIIYSLKNCYSLSNHPTCSESKVPGMDYEI